MICDHGDPQRPHPATRTFDAPGAPLMRLCETHAGFWIAKGQRPPGTVEILAVDLACSDIGLVAEPVDTEAHPGRDALIVARTTYLRWAAARAAWEDAQAEMATELSKASVDALALASELNGHERRPA